MKPILLVAATATSMFLGLSCASAPKSGTAGGTAPAPAATASKAAARPAAVDAESALKGRVTQYWKARQAKDLSAMYDLYSAGYRGAHPRTEFLGMTRLVRYPILEFHVVRVAIDGDGKRAKATVSYKSSAPQVADPFDSEVTDTWIVDPDGLWYKERDELVLPFPTGNQEARTGSSPGMTHRGLE